MRSGSLLAGLLLNFHDASGFLSCSNVASPGCFRQSTSRRSHQHDDSNIIFADSTLRRRRAATSPVLSRAMSRYRHHPGVSKMMAASPGGANTGGSSGPTDGGNESSIQPEKADAEVPSPKEPEDSNDDHDNDADISPAEDVAAEAKDADTTASSVVQEQVVEKEGEGGVEGEGEDKGEEEDEEQGETVFLPSGENTDFRLFRAKLRAGSDEKWQEQLRRNVNVAQLDSQDAWAHELSAPEKGCLIVAKSSEFSISQTYFNEAVIFLASHDEAGSAGFILNRPTQVCLGDLVEGNALPEFTGTRLYLGGDVGEGNVQILHPYGPDKLAGSMEIIPGVYIGGAVDEADRMVATGKAKADDFRFFLHLCGWAPGQLQAEIDRGVWFPAATSSNIVMKHCLGLPVPMWREVMTLMGPKFGLLARDTYDDL